MIWLLYNALKSACIAMSEKRRTSDLNVTGLRQLAATETIVTHSRRTPRILKLMASCEGIQSVFVFAVVTQLLLHTSVTAA